MAFMNARKRNKTLTYVIVAFVSVGLLLSVSLYWVGGSPDPVTGSAPAGSLEASAVQDFNSGFDLLQQGKNKEGVQKFNSAIKGFEAALKATPDNVQVLGDLATSYFYIGNVDKAIQLANKALEIDPNFSTARVNLAIYLFEGKKNAEEAVKELKKIGKSDYNYQRAQDLIAQFEITGTQPPVDNNVTPKN